MDRQESTEAIDLMMNSFYFNLYGILEDEFDCSGICEPANFYMTRPITDGPPEQNCIMPVSDYVKGQMVTWGACILLIFFYLFSLMVLGCCSCRNFANVKSDRDL